MLQERKKLSQFYFITPRRIRMGLFLSFFLGGGDSDMRKVLLNSHGPKILAQVKIN